MRIPIATYRLQFNPEFGFAAARGIVDYLSALGISDIYASPIFKARTGSSHGYDVVDQNQLNPELGGEAEFNPLIDRLHEQHLGWLQDIVPNHMAYDGQNPYLMDVLEHGPDSEYFNYFDIEWEAGDDLRGKVLAPLLGDFYDRCLERGEIQLSYDEKWPQHQLL
jgi:(1->4)-alpha-D-glucan 1-alpha-D-glucosylmutase